MEHYVRSMLEDRAGGVPGKILRGLLSPLGGIYGKLAGRRRRAYAQGRRESFVAGAPVLSVGNLTAGGVGKTPFVLLACDWLTAVGHRPALLFRGYKARGGRPDDADEVRLARERCPGALVLAGRDRVELARRAVAGGRDVIILDDGFQHGRLRRDADMVLLDAARPWGGGRCLPAGLLREPPDALAAAAALIMTRTDQAGLLATETLRSDLRRRWPAIPVYAARHAAARLTDLDGTAVPGGMSALAGRRVVAAAGIGRPDAFAHSLAEAGATVSRTYPFPDHHVYDERDAGMLRLAAATLGATLVVTEKDAVKLRDAIAAADRQAVWVLGVDMEIDDAASLRALLLRSVAAGKERVERERVEHEQ